MTKQLLFVLLSLLFVSIAKGQNQTVVISGKAPEYAGKTITLYELTEPISGEKTTVATWQFQSDGSFSTSLKHNKTSFCQADFDAWQAYLFLEPGKNYHLALPPYRAVSVAERRNPYFRPEVVPFGLVNAPATDLNRMVQAFELEFARQEDRFFQQIYRDKSVAAVDSLKAAINQQFPPSGNATFEDYKFYRLASAEYALHQGRNERFVKKSFVDHRPNLLVPTCYRLFEQLFSNYFGQQTNAVDGEQFGRLVAQAKLKEIEDALIQQKEWDRNLAQLVILKSIHDAFYTGQFSQQSLLTLLDKIAQSDWPAPKKEIAAKLKKKLTYLLAGTEAPHIRVTALDGQQTQLTAFRGKFVYLHFTSVTNPICRQHLDYLKKSAAPFVGKLLVVNLIPESELAKKDMIAQQEWTGEFFTISPTEAEKFRVKSFPTAYLISPEGELKLAPALNPLDGFDRQFSDILKKRQVEEWRRQAK
ncbi:MAG: TlpA family protein disulfide reductase [Mangrovibacterium sp.]